jgi:hypothetical protein
MKLNVSANGAAYNIHWLSAKRHELSGKNCGHREEESMLRVPTITLLFGIIAATITWPQAELFAQAPADPNGAPNPYRLDANWPKMPDGRKMGQVTGVDIDPDGKSVWAFDRCGAKDCVNSTLNPIQKFDASGNFVVGFGQGLFNHPHGFYVDREGNVWATDNIGDNGKGHQVIKFSPGGKVLLTLGRAGVAGEGPDMFNAPTDVAVAPNGDIIVSDGHGGKTNARIVKFTSSGKFIAAWGRRGSGPGEFGVNHSLASIRQAVYSSPTDPIIVSRSLARTVCSWRNGSSSAAQAASSSTRTTFSTLPIPNPTWRRIRASNGACELAA